MTSTSRITDVQPFIRRSTSWNGATAARLSRSTGRRQRDGGIGPRGRYGFLLARVRFRARARARLPAAAQRLQQPDFGLDPARVDLIGRAPVRQCDRLRGHHVQIADGARVEAVRRQPQRQVGRVGRALLAAGFGPERIERGQLILDLLERDEHGGWPRSRLQQPLGPPDVCNAADS